jgi:hypothetical protein
MVAPKRTTAGNAGDVVAAYVQGAKDAGLDTPGQSLRNRVGKQARELLREGKPVGKLTAAARHMGAVGWDDLARQLQRDGARANGHEPSPGHQPYRNPDDASAYEGDL